MGGASSGGTKFSFGGAGGKLFTDGVEGMDFTNMGGGGAFGGFGRQQSTQDPPIHRHIELTLEELFRGCTKKMKISRKVLASEGGTTSNEDKILTIDVKPGWKAGTKITFPREGDQSVGRIPADIIFVICLLYTSPSPRDATLSRMPSSA